MLDGSVMHVSTPGGQALLRPPPRHSRPSRCRLLVRAEGDPPPLAAKPALRPPPARPQPAPAVKQTLTPVRTRDAQQRDPRGDFRSDRGGGRGRNQPRGDDGNRYSRNGRATASEPEDRRAAGKLSNGAAPTANGVSPPSNSVTETASQAPTPQATQAETANPAPAAAAQQTAAAPAAPAQPAAEPSANGAVAPQPEAARAAAPPQTESRTPVVPQTEVPAQPDAARAAAVTAKPLEAPVRPTATPPKAPEPVPEAVRPTAFRPQAPNHGGSRPVRPRDSDAQQDGALNAGPTRPPPRIGGDQQQRQAQRPQSRLEGAAAPAPAAAAAPQFDNRGRRIRPSVSGKADGDGCASASAAMLMCTAADQWTSLDARRMLTASISFATCKLYCGAALTQSAITAPHRPPRRGVVRQARRQAVAEPARQTASSRRENRFTRRRDRWAAAPICTSALGLAQ